MPNSTWYSLASCFKQAQERDTVYVNSVVKLYKSSLVPTPATLVAELDAAEADYDDYAPITIAAWAGPILAPGSGYEILSPAILFSTGVTDPVVPNTIGGFWLEDAAGVVRMVGIFDPALPMQIANQGIPLNLLDIFPTGYVA